MHRIGWLLGLAGLTAGSAGLAPRHLPTVTQAPEVVGTWRLLSAKENGKPVSLPAGTTILKHVTPTDFVFVYYDERGQMTAAGGGPYALRGTRYEETLQYGLAAGVMPLLGKPQVFTLRIEGMRWYHTGKESDGTVVEEVWERVRRGPP